MRNEAALVARALRREMRQEREQATALNYERKPDSFPACAECRHEWQYSHLGVTTCLQCRQRLDDEKPGLVTVDLLDDATIEVVADALRGNFDASGSTWQFGTPDEIAQRILVALTSHARGAR